MTRRTLIALVLLFMVGWAVRLFRIQAQSLWFDEAWSAYAAVQPTLVDAWNADPTNPPLYYVLLNIAARAFGDSELALRLFSAFWGLIAAALAYRFGRRLFTVRAGLIAAALAALSPLLWWASQEARMYTLMAVLVLVCALMWHRLITRPNRTAWALLLLAELALLYTHNTGPIIALWLNVAAVCAWGLALARRERLQPAPPLWIGGQLIVGVLWLPYFVSRFLLLGEANSAVTAAPTLTPEFLARVWGSIWIVPWERIGTLNTSSDDLVLLITLSFVVSLVPLSLSLTRAKARWLLLHILLLTGGIIAGLVVLGNEFHGRYLVIVAPLLSVLLAAGLDRLQRPLSVLFGSALIALFTLNLVAFFPRDDVRGMVRYYASTLDSSDTVLAWSYADRYDLWYYWYHFDVPSKRVTLPEGADMAEVLPLLPESGDVALNVWYTQRADYRGMMHCLLSNGTNTPPATYTVYGMTNLLFRAPSTQPPALHPLNITFSEGGRDIAQVTRAAELSTGAAHRAACVPLEINVLSADAAPLKAALIVQNSLGWEIARADAVVADAAQRTTPSDDGGQMMAFPLLRLPYGTPPGDYPVFLRLYSETLNPSGYQPRSPDALGRDFPLGRWTVSAADWEANPPAVDLSNRVDLRIRNGTTLIAHDQPPEAPTLRNGDEIRLTLLWSGEPLPLLLVGAGWQVEIPAAVSGEGGIVRDWRSVRIPADAGSGTAGLQLPDGTMLARYTIDALPLQTEPPAFEEAVGARFPAVGELVGFTLGEVMADAPPGLTLVWQAGETPPPTAYTVFAQLISDDGRVMAQSDAYPGGRPTTGWRAGEYIEDAHVLRWNEPPTSDELTLMVGLYDALTGERVRLEDGADAVTLARVRVE